MRFTLLLITLLIFSADVFAGSPSNKKAKVGIATVLSGDLAVLGDNIAKTVETYKKRYLRHPIEFHFEDAKKGSMDGLRAYESLINAKKVDMLIGGTSSNGTIAGAPLINSSKTVMITPLTGGSNIDQAGPYIFRIGNSDIINGVEQAELFINKGFKKVAMYTEETEYTQDIAKYFRKKFEALGGKIVFDEDFLPSNTDFRAEITKLRSKKPQALFMGTQTGLAFGIFVKQLRELGGDKGVEIHTNFLAASNPDAFEAAGDAIYGVNYMAPYYDSNFPALKKFFKEFREDHGKNPAIEFHTAGTVDALNMLQDYLDTSQKYSKEGFRTYLLKNIKNYKGLMGEYSFDEHGNADIGFQLALIQKKGSAVN